MEPLSLQGRCLGGQPEDPTLVILHGMLGSSRNWATVGPALAKGFQVWALDLRNHGSSPHSPVHSYEAMKVDLETFRVAMGWEKIVLLGHSMGGKAAMRYAVDYPERVSKLMIVDIGPGDHDPYHAREVEALAALPLQCLENRREADEILARDVPDWAMRQFLLTNLRRRGKVWEWQVNLPVLQNNLVFLAQSPMTSGDRFFEPTLLVRGAESTFVSDAEVELAKTYFPELEAVTIPRAGHNVHVENKEAFVAAVRGFLED
ncbi:MAG: alpha/beta fold hydrolase [Opitutales bacterium]|nr:alpha/beta fold hydrolase [Opitutales bacterium]MCH8540663.1 alpha/beta fold hydrolase [Opitutales bacterium]